MAVVTQPIQIARHLETVSYTHLDVYKRQVSKIEDLNSAMLPVMLIAMISFYLGYINAVMPNSGSVLQKAAMYIPFSSPFIIPFRLLNGDVLASDLIISIALLIVAIVVITLICIRIYAASVLQYRCV